MRYKRLGLLIVILCGISFFAQKAYAAPRFAEGIVNSSETALFLRADLTTPVICVLDEGTSIGVYSQEGEFARVIFGNYRGYVKRDRVFIPTEDVYEANVYGSNVRLRMGPSEHSTVIAELEENTSVKIESANGEWYRIYATLNNKEFSGFVAREYILITGRQSGDIVLKPDMEGASVKTLQIELKKRGFLDAAATGYYGLVTKQAVGDFQVAAGLSSDGIAGQETLKLLYEENDIKANPETATSNNNGIDSSSSSNSGYRINFFTSSGTDSALAQLGRVRSLYYTDVYGVFPVGSSAKITIVASGQSFNIKRNTGTSSSPHADVEPKTSSDAATLKTALGGSYVSARCPVWITIGSTTYAASIYSVPHAEDLSKIKDNNFPGVFCVHFTDSRGNSSGVVDEHHQAAIAFALDVAN